MLVFLARAYFELLRMEAPLYRDDFAKIHRLVRSVRTKSVVADQLVLARLFRAVDLASVFYFKEVKCLQRAAVATRLLRKFGIPAEMVIGVQFSPFRSHAWVEVNESVVNDKPDLRQVYTVLESC